MLHKLANGVNVEVVKEVNKTVNVLVEITAQQRQDFLQQFPQKKISWQNASHTFTLQNALAKFGKSRKKKPIDQTEQEINALIDFVFELTRQYADLEALINRPNVIDRLASIEGIENKLEQLKENLFFLTKEKGWQTGLFLKLKQQIEFFQQHLTQLNQTIPTIHQLHKLHAAQALSPRFQSLGGFVGKQQYTILSEAIKAFDSIQDSRILQSVVMHPARKALSDAKAAMEIKTLSLYGARYNNTYSPIPVSMVQAFQPVKNPHEKRWLSLQPYIGDFSDLSAVDKMLCEVGNVNINNRQRAKLLPLIVLSVGSNLIEFIATIVLRTTTTAISLLTSLFVFPVLNFITFRRVPNNAKQLDEMISQLHHNYSLTAKVKIWAQAKYQRNDNNQAALQDLKMKPFSVYAQIFEHPWLTGSWLAASFYLAIKNFSVSLTSLSVEPIALFSVNHQKQADAYVRMQQQVDYSFSQQLTLKQDTISPSTSHDNSEPPAEDSRSCPSLTPANTVTNESERLMWPAIMAWPANEFHSAIDFFDEIASTLSDSFIEVMFRHSPIPASVFYGLAMASLGTLTVPSFAGNLGVAGQILQTIPAWLTKHMTGAGVSEGLAHKIVGCFIEWKALFLPSEAVLGAKYGDYEYLRKILANPEKILISLTLLAGVGYFLHFIPHIDSHAAAVLNFFSHEAQECLKGTPGLNSVELVFLGLKFLLLMSSMFSGQQCPQIEPRILCEKVMAKLRESDFFLQDAAERKLIIKKILQQHLGEQADIEVAETLLNSFADELLMANSDFKLRGGLQKLTVPQQVPPITPRPIDQARNELKEAVNVIIKMEMLGESFANPKFFDRLFNQSQAKLFFDHFCRLVNNHNEIMREMGYHEHVFDARDIKHSFYNKHCYTGSSHIFRLLTLPLTTPVLGPVWWWRKAKVAIASTQRFYSPSVLHQVCKSEHKDHALMLQPVAFMARLAHSFVRANNYLLLRFPFYVVGTVVGIIPFVFCKSYRDNLYERASHINLHHGFLTQPLVSLYARATRVAGVNHEALLVQCGEYLERLDSSLADDKSYTSGLADYYQSAKSRLFGMPANRAKQLERLAAAKTTEKAQPVFDELSGGLLKSKLQPYFCSPAIT